jgi:hypothetical protein
MQKTIYNQQKPYVYIWRDRLSNRYYIGYHGGFDPNYVCSSRPMIEQYRQRPEDFRRRILATGTQEEMAVLEKQLIQKRKKHLGERYYNLAISWPICKWTDDMRQARSKLYKGRKVSEETRRKISEGAKRREKNMTVEKKKQRSDKISYKNRGKRGPQPNMKGRASWNKGKILGTFAFDRKLYDYQRKITLRNQDFLLFGL